MQQSNRTAKKLEKKSKRTITMEIIIPKQPRATETRLANSGQFQDNLGTSGDTETRVANSGQFQDNLGTSGDTEKAADR